jgi:PKD repeat protein
VHRDAGRKACPALRRPSCGGLLALALALFAAPALAAVAAPAPAPQRAVLPQPSEDIACSGTPFGRQLTLGGDAEFIEVLGFSGTSSTAPDALHEWVLPPDPDEPGSPAFESDLSLDWSAGTAFTGATLLGSIGADLDGDGQDEVIVMARIYQGGERLGVGVLHRVGSGAGASLELADTWASNETFEQARLVAGDLDGSQDGSDELALWIRHPGDSISIMVLTGADGGVIAQDDDTAAGRWNWTPPAGGGIGESGFAAGPLVLDGSDQLVLVTETNQWSGGNDRRIRYHLLEFQPASPAVFPVLPGDSAIGTRFFQTVIGNNFAYGFDGDESSEIRGSGIVRMKADVGDVVGDAAAELVTHYEFESVSDQLERHQRLQHFVATRSASGAITDVQLWSSGAIDFDDGVKLTSGEYEVGWDSVVRNIDDSPKAEIIEVGNTYAPPDSLLDASVYRVAYDLAANFTWYRSGRDVQFTENSVGYGAGPFDNPVSGARWDFGDGSTSNSINPTHHFDDDRTYTVKLTVREVVGSQSLVSTHSVDIVVDADSNGSGEGIDSSEYRFRIHHDPVYFSRHDIGDSIPLAEVHADAADMDRDGAAEVMSVSRQGVGSGSGNGMLRSRWRLHYNPQPPHDFIGTHQFEPDGGGLPLAFLEGMSGFAADFDGDSVHATLGSDCRRVEEAQVRQLIWTPPYFQRLQAGATRAASFGRSTTGGSGQSRQFGSFTSHDVSGYVGGSLGFDLFGLVGAEASIRATAGHYEQVAHGGLVGSENGYALTQGWTQSNKEALLVLEDNTFDCYAYDVSQAAVGIDPDSSVRICEIQDDATFISGSDPDYWDREFPLPWASGSEGHPPPNWAPLGRDWASLALFKPVRTNATFVAGSGAEHLTDGRFTAAVESAPRSQPFVEIDLGWAQPVTGIRVFAPDGELASDLAGFRVFTSTSPMPQSGLPAGPGVHEFAPDSLDDTVYDRWNIWTRAWDDSEPGLQPGDPLRVRYIRLQHPGNGVIRVGELQVFGEVHGEPPHYPDAVCDPTSHDGFFLAKVWDATAGAFREIELRGDMLWNGSGPLDGSASWGADGPYLQGCTNNVDITGSDMHSNFDVGFSGIATSADQEWSFSESNEDSVGSTTSFENSTRVGAEFDLSLSAFATMVGGGASEFTSGVTEDDQTVNYWGTGVDVGGAIGGFQPPYDIAEYVNACRYAAKPYAYELQERSDTGYLHAIYAVDYVVPESGSGSGGTAWTRADMPERCLPQAIDRIFASGFDGDCPRLAREGGAGRRRPPVCPAPAGTR